MVCMPVTPRIGIPHKPWPVKMLLVHALLQTPVTWPQIMELAEEELAAMMPQDNSRSRFGSFSSLETPSGTNK